MRAPEHNPSTRPRAARIEPYGGRGWVGALKRWWFAGTDRPAESGAEGENRVLDWLSWVDRPLVIYNRLSVPNPKSRTGATELDLLALDPAAGMILEIKNHHGGVLATDRTRQWWILQTGPGGHEYWRTMRNPVRQVIGARLALQRYLSHHGVRVQPRAAVVLAHPGVDLMAIESLRVPLIASREALYRWIKKTPAGSTDPTGAWEKAIPLLDGLISDAGSCR